jgi:hypothetical protein
MLWKAAGMMNQGWVAALTGNPSNAIQMITSGITVWRSTGATTWMPLYLPLLARAYAELGQFENAWRSIGEAMTAVERGRRKPTSTALLAKPNCCRRNLMQRKRKRISTARSQSRVNSKQDPGSSAQQ